MAITRYYSSVATEKTISTTPVSVSGAGSTTITLNNKTGLPNEPFTLVLSPDTTDEEIVTATSLVSGTTYNITRGEEGTTPRAHAIGNTVRHMITARDLTATQEHYDSTENVHGISATADIVYKNSTQTLTNKTYKIGEDVVLTAKSTDLNKLAGLATTATELGYVNGVTSSIQSQISSINSTISALEVFPKGMISPYAGSTAPTGWLMCDGSAVSRTTYSALFGVIGSTYGSGDNSTTFNVPDLRGRTPIGAGTGTGLTSRVRGTTYGQESTTLTSAHIPEHRHTIDHDHGAFTSGDDSPDHSHTGGQYAYESGGALSGTTNYYFISGDGHSRQTGGASARHQHNIDVPNFSGNSGYYGTTSPTAVTAMQPSLAVNYIIKH